ncbi:hypothetical protein [Allorhizobium terrae]|nr:hypothetical protein [Allorhizobium terrae]TWD55311.1 hypothetical protein FB480_102120 [Agrobacterium vitis]
MTAFAQCRLSIENMPIITSGCIDKNQIAPVEKRKLEFFVMMSHTGVIAP